jgi:hypothetical protein
MIINRVWAMPSKDTFTIKPIQELIKKYVPDGTGWIDPFAGKNSPAELTNDLNPNIPTKYHLQAEEFANMLTGQYNGVLFDPPYSLRQIKECYKSIGIEPKGTEWTLDASFGKVKDILAPKIKIQGYAISCGWNTNGFGINRGFEIIEILLVPHGGHHNDTICTVERKTYQKPNLFN